MAILQAYSRGLRLAGQQSPRGSARIDWRHPITNGLLFYAIDTGGWLIDLVRYTTAGYVGTTDSAGMTAYGPGINWGANGGSSIWFPNDAKISAAGSTNNISWACAYIQTGTVAAYTRPFGRTANNGGAVPYVNWDFEINPASAGQNTVNANFSSVAGLASSPNWTGNANNVFTSLAATCMFLGGNHTTDLYAQGQYVSTHGGDIPQDSPTNSSIMFSGASNASVISNFVGKVFYGAFWARTLSADEIAYLHADPYCFLIPTEGEMPILLAPPTLTLQGFQPRVLM
jgi:hypothetical protein